MENGLPFDPRNSISNGLCRFMVKKLYPEADCQVYDLVCAVLKFFAVKNTRAYLAIGYLFNAEIFWWNEDIELEVDDSPELHKACAERLVYVW